MPAAKSASLMASVEATKAPVRTVRADQDPVRVQQVDLAVGVELARDQVEGVDPVTRFIAEDVDGCSMSTRPPSPIEKPRQLTMALGEDCRMVMAPRRGRGDPDASLHHARAAGEQLAGAGG